MRLNFKMLHLGAAVFTGLLFLTGCAKDEGVKSLDDVLIQERGLINGTSVSTALIGLSASNELVNLVSGPPALETSVVPITGLRDGENILAIDTRPKNKQLYGVSSMGMIYVIDKISGAVFPISTAPLNPPIAGDMVAFDFNQTEDVIRLITNTGQNLRINPNTGAVSAVDPIINSSSFSSSLNSAAYTYSTGLQGKSLLYAIDISTADIYRSLNPNTGMIQFVGSTGFLWSGEGGFDITPSNVGFAVYFGRIRNPSQGGTLGGGFDDATEDANRLYRIDLRTGKAISHGKTRPLIGITAK